MRFALYSVLRAKAMSVGETFGKKLISFYIPLVFFTVLMLFPFYWMLITSVKPNKELYSVKSLPFWVFNPTIEHWTYLFKNTLFTQWTWNTLFISIVSTTISLISGIMAGYALSRLKFKGASALGIIIFITYLVPPTLLFIPLAEVVHNFSLLDTPWALILTYPTFLIPFCTWLLSGYFKTIPKELEECARIDGATRLQAMIWIVLPLATPGILSAGMFAFTLSWNEFIYALVFLSSPNQKTIPVGVVSELIKGDVFFWGSLMAGALFGSVPVALIYSFFVEHYVTGLTGAVKG